MGFNNNRQFQNTSNIKIEIFHTLKKKTDEETLFHIPTNGNEPIGYCFKTEKKFILPNIFFFSACTGTKRTSILYMYYSVNKAPIMIHILFTISNIID